MRNRTRRALLLFASMAGFSLCTALVLASLRDNIVYFKTPQELRDQPMEADQPLRIGGYVRPGSVRRKGTRTHFTITDFSHDIEVTYDGLLPDLFREGQGVIADGSMVPGGTFRARSVLAKHDETYRPPGVPHPPANIGK